jgi:hypothetical protein
VASELSRKFGRVGCLRLGGIHAAKGESNTSESKFFHEVLLKRSCEQIAQQLSTSNMTKA